GAVSRTLSAPPCVPSSAFARARGCTRTGMRTSSPTRRRARACGAGDIPYYTGMTLSKFGLCLAAAASVGHAQTDRWTPTRNLANALIKDSGLVSVSIAVAQHGAIVWEEAFGWADRDRKVRSTPNTMYSLASISKPFTATGLMVLVERGKID